MIKKLLITIIAILTLVIGGVLIESLTEKSFSGTESVKIDGLNKTISFTDENVGENLIIKSDSKDYYGFGGETIFYFSITNLSPKDQIIDVVYSLGGDIVSTKRFVRNDTITKDITIPATATSTEQTITQTTEKTVWSNLSLSSPNIKDVVRKPVRGTSKNGFSDTILKNETKVYQASIRGKEDEFFIEAFGDSAYGNLDPNLWAYEQKFNDLNDGDLNGQDSWTSNSSNVDVVTTGTPYEGAKHVKFLRTTGSVNATRTITGVVSGTVYVSMKVNAISAANSFYFSINQNDSVGGAYVYLSLNGDIKVYDGLSLTDTGLNYSADTYYRIGIAFETGAGGWEGLSADTWKFNIDGGDWNGPYASFQACSEMAYIQIGYAGDTNSYAFLDYISHEYSSAVVSAPTQEDVILFDY